jgi:hypothetical protein
MRALIAAALFVAPMSSAFAAQALWEGELYVETASAGCASDDVRTGFFSSHYHAVFRPRNIGDNGTDTKLALYTPRSAFTLSWVGKNYGNATVNGTEIGGSANAFPVTMTFSGTSMAPSSIAAATPTVVLKGKIKSFWNDPNCTVTFVAGLGRRPNLDQPAAP